MGKPVIQIAASVITPDDDRLDAVKNLAMHMGADVNGITVLPSGKMEVQSIPSLGFSVSHFRLSQNKLTLLALCSQNDFGIDAEVWPEGDGDPGFIATIATSEDTASLKTLAAQKRNPATALWVIKEATLKAADQVNIDPRALAVLPFKNGVFKVVPGKRAMAPMADHYASVMCIKSQTGLSETVCVAFAVPSFATIKFHLMWENWVFNCHLNIAYYNYLMLTIERSHNPVRLS